MSYPLETLRNARKVQEYAAPYVKTGKYSLSYIYFNFILKHSADPIPITRQKFYRYMRIDTSRYRELLQEFVDKQYETERTECQRRNGNRRANRLKTFLAQREELTRKTEPAL